MKLLSLSWILYLTMLFEVCVAAQSTAESLEDNSHFSKGHADSNAEYGTNRLETSYAQSSPIVIRSFLRMLTQPKNTVCSVQAYNVGAVMACYLNMDNWKYWRTVYKIAQQFGTYGCWCGRLGAGTPVDAIDSCCKAHDKCFDDVMYNAPGALRGKQAKIHMVKYKAKCTLGQKNRKIICVDKRGTGRKLCDCDKAFAACIKNNIKVWNKSYDCIRGKGFNRQCGPQLAKKGIGRKNCPVSHFISAMLGKTPIPVW